MSLVDDLRSAAAAFVPQCAFANPRIRVRNSRMPQRAPRGPRSGERHPKAKLTDIQVREMRHLHERCGKGYRLLGQIFGVSQWTARDIATYRTRIGA